MASDTQLNVAQNNEGRKSNNFLGRALSAVDTIFNAATNTMVNYSEYAIAQRELELKEAQLDVEKAKIISGDAPRAGFSLPGNTIIVVVVGVLVLSLVLTAAVKK